MSVAWQTELLETIGAKDVLFFKKLVMFFQKSFAFPVHKRADGKGVLILSGCTNCGKELSKIVFPSLLVAHWKACELTIEGKTVEGDLCDECLHEHHQQYEEERQEDEKERAEHYGRCVHCGSALFPLHDDPRDDGTDERLTFCHNCDHYSD